MTTLEKIRAEVADLDDVEYEIEGYYKAVNDALQIIDKYADQEPCDDADQIGYHDDFETALRKIHDYEERQKQNDKKCGNCKLIGTDSCYMVCGGSKSLYKPKQKSEPCTDAVSRQAVLDINESHHGQMPNHINHQIWQEIKDLPPVTPQPKTGRWIEDEQQVHVVKTYHCSECGYDAWDEEKEGCELMDSDICKNCPLNRLS